MPRASQKSVEMMRAWALLERCGEMGISEMARNLYPQTWPPHRAASKVLHLLDVMEEAGYKLAEDDGKISICKLRLDVSWTVMGQEWRCGHALGGLAQKAFRKKTLAKWFRRN